MVLFYTFVNLFTVWLKQETGGLSFLPVHSICPNTTVWLLENSTLKE